MDFFGNPGHSFSSNSYQPAMCFIQYKIIKYYLKFWTSKEGCKRGKDLSRRKGKLVERGRRRCWLKYKERDSDRKRERERERERERTKPGAIWGWLTTPFFLKKLFYFLINYFIILYLFLKFK
jgi:hypothetical protein